MKVLPLVMMIALSATVVLGSPLSSPKLGLGKSIRKAYNDVYDFLGTVKTAFIETSPPPPKFDKFNPFFQRFHFFGIDLNCVANIFEHEVIENDVKAAWNEFVDLATKNWMPCMIIEDKSEREKCITDVVKEGREFFTVFNKAVDKEPFSYDVKAKLRSECIDEDLAFEGYKLFA